MTSTVDKIINCAESQIRTAGYNGFSFREIAKEIGIKSASIHYHFPTKPDLASLVAKRYGEKFGQMLSRIASDTQDTQKRLILYIDIFKAAVKTDKKMCLCGILASEAAALPSQLQQEVKRFFDINLNWLAQSIFLHQPKAHAQAAQLLASLEGCLLLTNAMLDDTLFDLIAEQIIQSTQTSPFK